MEPKILIIGRDQRVINILVAELERFGRHVVGANSKEMVKTYIQDDQLDFVVMGAGLADDVRKDMQEFIQAHRADLPINLIARTSQSGPAKMIPFVNEKAIEFKIEKVIGKRGAPL